MLKAGFILALNRKPAETRREVALQSEIVEESRAILEGVPPLQTRQLAMYNAAPLSVGTEDEGGKEPKGHSVNCGS